MPRQSKIDKLPAELRAALDKLVLDNNFSGYESIAEYFKERGYSLSKSGIHRYGQELERKLEMIKGTTEAAKIIGEANPDTENHMTGGLLSIVQAGLFHTLLKLNEAQNESNPEERIKLYSSAAKGVSEVGRASIANKRWQGEVRAKAEAAASKVADIARKGGLSADTAETIRREILGIAS